MTLIPKRPSEERTVKRVTSSMTEADLQILDRYAKHLEEPMTSEKEKRATRDLILHRAIQLLGQDLEREEKKAAAEKATAPRKRANKAAAALVISA